MIKRRFYRHEHADGDDASNSSSSSSDSEVEAESTEETEAEEDDVAEAREYREAPSSSSGYESEDSSENEVDDDSSGLLTIDDETGNDGNFDLKSHSSDKSDAVIELSNTVAEKDSGPSDVACILKCKSVFRCRFCPKVVCLTEETLKAHLKSKRHARSEKLLGEGRLKLMLNSDGEIEGEGETHAERHARFVAAAQNSASTGKKNKGRQRQRKRLKKKPGKESNLDKARQSTKGPAKKRHKGEPKAYL